MNVFLVFVLLQIVLLMYFNTLYFLKTRDYLVLGSLVLQISVGTICFISIINRTLTTPGAELLILLFGIVLPLIFLSLDKPLLKGRVFFHKKPCILKKIIPERGDVNEIATIIPEKETELLLSNLSAKELLSNVNKRLDFAKKFVETNQLEKALGMYAGLEDIIKNRYFYYNYGNLFYRMGDYENAKVYYKRALDFFKDKHSSSNNKKARKDTGKRLKKEEVLYNIANAYYMQGFFCEAMANYERVIEMDHNFKGGIDNYIQTLLKIKNFDKAVSCCNSMLEKKRGYKYHFLLARIYYELNKSQECVEQLDKALSLEPNHVDSLALLGEVYSNIQEPNKALEIYTKLVKLTPQDYSVQYSLGKLFMSGENYHQAIERFKLAYDLNSNMFEALYNVGLSYEKNKQIQEAIDVYKKVIKNKPDFLGAYTRVWNLLSKENRFSDVVEIFEKGILTSPKEYVLHFYLGVAYSKLEMYSMALDSFKSVLDINPEMKGVNFYLGIILTKLEKYEEAIHTFRNALLDTRDDNEVFYNMAITYCMQERYERAISSLKKAVELNPEIKDKVCENQIFDYLKEQEEFSDVLCLS